MTKRRVILKHFKKLIHDIVCCMYSERTEKRGRKDKYSIWFYIKYIVQVLVNGTPWNKLSCTCDPSTIKKKFYKWNSMNVFYIAYVLLLDEYYEYSDAIKILFIDSTTIENQNCSECVGYTYKLKGKKATKITTVIDSNKMTLAHQISKPSIHDVNMIQTSTQGVIETIKPTYHDPLYIVGDKGYISKDIKDELRKKNAKKKKYNYTYENKPLKERYRIEASYSHLKKQYGRIKLLKDSKISTYNTFLLMGLTNQFLNYFAKHHQLTKIHKKCIVNVHTMAEKITKNSSLIDSYFF